MMLLHHSPMHSNQKAVDLPSKSLVDLADLTWLAMVLTSMAAALLCFSVVYYRAHWFRVFWYHLHLELLTMSMVAMMTILHQTLELMTILERV
jgi:hypothetical protein